MNRKIVFIGGLWTPEDDEYINNNSKHSVQNAANVLQNSIIRGLDEIVKKPVTILSMLFIGAYPKLFKRPIINSKIFNHSTVDKHKDYNIGFLNFPIIKHLSKTINIRKYIRRECVCDNDTELYVIGYSMTYAITKSLKYVKRINRNATTCLIIPDLPEYMSDSTNIVFEILKGKSNEIVYKDISFIDSYVLLTDEMYNRLNSKHPYVVMEGIAPQQNAIMNNKNDGIKRIVYTGGLSIRYGIKDLVDAFMNIKGSEYRLLLCGSGDAEKYILEKSKLDDRIIYKGSVSNDVARKIQEEAFILVNPRKPEGEFTKYSFPSKTMEYMLSGRPVVMYKLDGIPEEYDNYLYYVDDSLETALLNILKISDEKLKDKGRSAREFIISNKNAKAQAGKIISMMSKVQNNSKLSNERGDVV